MKRLGISAAILLLAAFVLLSNSACGSKEGDGSVSVSLEEETVDRGAAIPVTPVAEEETPAAQEPPAPQAASTDAILFLDQWHRALETERARLVKGSGADAQAVAEFAKIWSGGAAAYRARLEISPVTRFGADFERYGKAFAKDGTAGLQRALERGTAAGPAFLVWTDALAQISLNEQDLKAGGLAAGTLLNSMLAAGYDRFRVLELTTTCNALASQVASFLPFEDYKVEPNDSYWTICRKFRKKGIDAYQGWVAEYNGKRNYNLREGERLRIPTASLHLTAWRQARVAALFADGVPIRLYSISVGKPETPTPTGEFTIDICEKEPMWYPPEGGAIPFGNKDNPLGARWIGFKEDPSYAFHGNNSPDTLGGFESRGCIRMDNEAVIELFEMVGPGVKVTIHP